MEEAPLLLHKHRQRILQRQQEKVPGLGVFFSPPPPFYIFNLVTASLISLDLKPPRET